MFGTKLDPLKLRGKFPYKDAVSFLSNSLERTSFGGKRSKPADNDRADWDVLELDRGFVWSVWEPLDVLVLLPRAYGLD